MPETASKKTDHVVAFPVTTDFKDKGGERVTQNTPQSSRLKWLWRPPKAKRDPTS